MVVFRLLLVVVTTLAASVSGAMDAGHMAVVQHGHTPSSEVAAHQPICCSESSERAQTCHGLPALLPGADLNDAVPATGEDVFIVSGMLLTGIEPSDLLDPPRAA